MKAEELKAAVKLIQIVQGFSNEQILKLPPTEFVLACRLLNPQRYGSLCERWLCSRYGLARAKGGAWWDATDNDDNKIEIKASLPSDGKPFNLVQIRLFHPLDSYLIMGATTDTIKVWSLTHDEMEKECRYANSAHGKTDRTRTDQELRLSFMPGSEVEGYWDRHFLKEKIDI